MTDMLPTIVLLMVPATLPSRAQARTDGLRYHEQYSGLGRMTGDELLAEIPELGDVARIEVDPGNEHAVATPADLVAFSRHVQSASDKPVVITGAQRPFSALGTDGPANLYNAFRVAASTQARGKGVLVTVNDEIHTARDVTKTSTYRTHTFKSREFGPLGVADGDGVRFYRLPLRRHTTASEFRLTADTVLPRIDVIYGYAGANGDLAEAAVGLGAKGLVIAGVGAGSLGDMRETVARLCAAGTAVVRSARVGEGRVVRQDNWQEPGMVAADNLNPQKSALLLALALTVTDNPERIQSIFDSY
ncbi:MAG: asparaginase [Alphaproteobacteria bacterium]